MTIFHPLGPIVWAGVIASLAAISVVMCIVSNLEKGLMPNLRLKQWTRIRQAFWYSFGTLLGESITRDTKMKGAWGLR